MKLSAFTRRALGACVAAMLTGCGGTPMPGAATMQGAAPSQDGTQVSTRTPAARNGNHLKTWMASGVSKGILVYAGGDQQSYVFSFPGGKLVGNIAGTSLGMCSDGEGDVFFTQSNQIVEYRHGGTAPVATYGVSGTAYACSINPKNGDLAAVVFCISSCNDEVAVFSTPGKGPPKLYRDAQLTSMLYCTYDNSGNLFVDGYNNSQFELAELSSGSDALTNISVTPNIALAQQVQWDGQYIAVETRIKPTIYQLQVSGSTATVVGETTLKDVGNRAGQSWISGPKIVLPTAPGTKRPIELVFWKYPHGGRPTKTISGFIGGGHQQLDGVTFSVRPPG